MVKSQDWELDVLGMVPSVAWRLRVPGQPVPAPSFLVGPGAFPRVGAKEGAVPLGVPGTLAAHRAWWQRAEGFVLLAGGCCQRPQWQQGAQLPKTTQNARVPPVLPLRGDREHRVPRSTAGSSPHG